jgi:hypothetical protein
MTAVIARMLLDQMDEMKTDMIWYRCQNISRRYLRHIIWKAYAQEDHRRELRRSGRVMI